MSEPIIETPREQLARVQAAIAKIEGGAQEVEFNGRRLRRADLKALYDREKQLYGIISSAQGIRVSRIIP